MLLIGSQALKVYDLLPVGREPKDYDYICTIEELNEWMVVNTPDFCYPISGTKYIAKLDGMMYEFEIAWEGSSAWELVQGWVGVMVVADPVDCLALKLSHRYLRNSPYFLKTMEDILWLRTMGVELTDWHKKWLVKREAETYNYSHPKLSVKKDDFFKDDAINYIYDHDSIHKAVAIGKVPAYTLYMKDGEQVMTEKEKFFALPPEVQYNGVLEEAYVLSLERYMIPNYFKVNAKKGFDIALMKICTSITSGWFREFAWENYFQIQKKYDESYVEKFKKGIDSGVIQLV